MRNVICVSDLSRQAQAFYMAAPEDRHVLAKKHGRGYRLTCVWMLDPKTDQYEAAVADLISKGWRHVVNE